MKKLTAIIRKQQIIYISIALAAFLIGWLLSGSEVTRSDSHAEHGHDHGHALTQEESGVWTCSMHPQIRQDKPGDCPLCGMSLIPLRQNDGGDETIDPSAIQLSEEAVALANVHTTRISRKNPVKTVRLYGKIIPDERSLQSQTAYVGGRIEKLNVEFTGETVHAGQTLAVIYSPELFTAQQELLEATRIGQPPLVKAAREKLRLWNMTESQVDAILRSGVASPMVEVKANTSGIVIAKRVSRGDYVSQGAVLFDVADLSHVWAMFEAFEVDLPFLGKGDRVNFSLQAFPGKQFSGTISFIDPIINATTRTARIRVDVVNEGQKLKPEMYATAEVNASLKEYNDRIIVPRSAVLWTGKRAIVYVRQPDVSSPAFLLREVELGPSLGDSYVVMNGLSDGEEIVTDGVFSIDASAQLEGKRSMMNDNSEIPQPMTGHAGHGGHTGHAGHQMRETTDAPADHAMIPAKGACEMCKERIEKAAMSVDGVASAHWDNAKQVVHLSLDLKKTTVDAVSEAIAKAGHDTDKYKADKAVYDNLPGCCKYRE